MVGVAHEPYRMACRSSGLGARTPRIRSIPRAHLPVLLPRVRQARRLLVQAGEDRITIKVRLQSQPWHMYSGVIVRCILAASTLAAGKAAAKSVMAAIAAHREEFEFERHCRGANLDATPNDIIARIENYSGVALAAAFAIPDLDREIKWHCK